MRSLVCFSALVLGLALGACGGAPAQIAAPPPSPTVAPVVAPPPSVAADPTGGPRIAADVTYLASPELAGRGTGEDGNRLAREYIHHRFEELGLAPILEQPFTAKVGAKADAPVVAIETGKAGKPIAIAAPLMSSAEGSASGSVRGDAVFVGHGVSAPAVGWDDYAGADVEGKIVVVLDGPPTSGSNASALKDFGHVRYKLRTAREHKAAGVVVVRAGEDLPAPPEDASSMGVPAVVVMRSAAKALLPKDADTADAPRKPAPIAKTTIAITTHVEPVTVDAFNVVGTLSGSDASAREPVVVGAHYDHLGHGGTSASRAPGVRAIHPGADDNASGTAMMLEVARRLTHLQKKPLRPVIFVAFGAEEIGLIGSHYFVDHPPQPSGVAFDAMINADMVGRMREDRLLVEGTGTSAAWPEIIKKASEGLGLRITEGTEGFGASDHTSFTATGVPVAFLFTGVHDDYHMPSDTPDKINSVGIERVATLAARMALDVADRADKLAFVNAPSDPHHGMRGGFRVSLGTIPDYAWQGKGVRLSGVRPDAPAARAGMQGGDVIVKVGEHDITNIHDYVYALGELEAGRKVSVEIERDGKRIPIEVVPAPGR